MMLREGTDILVFWNRTYPDFLTQYFGQGNIYCGLSELSENDGKKLSQARGIVILAELNWNGKKLSDFYGFEILSRLRAEHRLKCPITVCSFMPEPWLRKKFPILEFPQHHPLVRLPARPEMFVEKIEKAEFADEFRLNDIIMSYCDLKGRLVGLITHGKGFRHITRALRKDEASDSLFSNCLDDLALLKNYLMNKALGDTISILGAKLVVKLQEAIQLRNFEMLLATRSVFDSLVSELRNSKNLSIAHLQKAK